MHVTAKFQCSRALLAACFFLFPSVISLAQETIPPVVEVYLQGTRTLPVPGITSVAVLDDSICRAQASTDKIQFLGISRGETVALAWINDRHFTIRIRVVPPPETLPPPHLSQNALDALGNGIASTSVQAFIDPQGHANYFLLHQFDWQQQLGRARMIIQGQAQNNTAPGAPRFNTDTLSVQYSTPRAKTLLGDYPLFVNGGLETKVSPFSSYNAFEIRGADETLHRGANQLEFFGGTTLPSYYLNLSGTRDVAGFNFSRTQSDKLYLYATSGWVNAPISATGAAFQRENSFFQTAGVVYRPSGEWTLQATAGESNRGLLLQSVASFTGEKLSAFVSGADSSANFPLNQLQLLSAGGSSLAAGTSYKVTSHIAASLYAQHGQTQSAGYTPVGGRSDYLNPNLSFNLSSRQALTLNYTYTRNSSGQALLGRNQGHRLDAALNSRFGRAFSNTAQISAGSTSDPLELNAQGRFSARDTFSFPLRKGYFTLGVQHTASDPSLVNRLNQEIGLLAPALQQLFQANPLGFADSSQLDPSIRALLQNLQPTDTELGMSGQFRVGQRLTLSPNIGYIHDLAGLGRSTSSKRFGYALSWQISPTTQLTSSLSDVYLLQTSAVGARRTTVINVSFSKTMRGAPRWLLPLRPMRRTLIGRVFSDLNVNGAYNSGEPGLAAIRVDLNTGQSTRTDAQGRYEFSGLAPDAYRVSVPLAQFAQAVRATGPLDVRVDLIEEKTAEVNFGIVNFARVTGTVYNDYLMNGQRQPDANGLTGIRVLLSDASGSHDLLTDGSGGFEFSQVPPGEYTLSIDRNSLPSNYVAPANAVVFHVAPTSTVVQDIPVRALRSISGHVYFKTSAGILKTSAHASSLSGGNPLSPPAETYQPYALQPLAGVKVAAGPITTTTDASGAFILRNLPSGNVMVTLVPTIPVPADLNVPHGAARLPREPIQVENASVVISNPELLKYLLPLRAMN